MGLQKNNKDPSIEAGLKFLRYQHSPMKGRGEKPGPVEHSRAGLDASLVRKVCAPTTSCSFDVRRQRSEWTHARKIEAFPPKSDACLGVFSYFPYIQFYSGKK